jgi:diguanylate cyclase (GGDEF)-like protein
MQRVYQAPEGKGPEEQALGGFVAAPIVTAGRVTGMLALAGRAAGRVGAETESFLAQVANQAMIVSENSRLFDRVRNLSIRDGLTGVFNRRHVMEVLGIEYERSARYSSEMSVIMVDIDHFKKINDVYHHQAGDTVIRDVAKLLSDSVRSVDSVGRYGGEEFIAILPHTHSEGARLIAERVRRGVEAQVFKVTGDREIRCTVSVGVASAPSDTIRSASDLVREADKALYRAKESGRNQVV